MSKIAGRLGRVAISTDGGASFTDVNGISDMTFNTTTEEIDVTTHDDNIFRTFIQGRKEGSLDLSMMWDEDDPGQNALRNAYFGATQPQFRFRLQEGTNRQEFLASGFISNWTPAAPNDDAATMDVTIRFSGAFSPGLQP